MVTSHYHGLHRPQRPGAHDNAVEFVVFRPPDDVVGGHQAFFQDGGHLDALGVKLRLGLIQPLLVFGSELFLDVAAHFIQVVRGHGSHCHDGDLGPLFFG